MLFINKACLGCIWLQIQCCVFISVLPWVSYWISPATRVLICKMMVLPLSPGHCGGVNGVSYIWDLVRGLHSQCFPPVAPSHSFNNRSVSWIWHINFTLEKGFLSLSTACWLAGARPKWVLERPSEGSSPLCKATFLLPVTLTVAGLSYCVCIAIQFQHVLTETFNHRDLERPLPELLWVQKLMELREGLFRKVS